MFGDSSPGISGRTLDTVPTWSALRNSEWLGADSVLVVSALMQVSIRPPPPELVELEPLSTAVDWALSTSPDHPLAAFLSEQPGSSTTAGWRDWKRLRETPLADLSARLDASERLYASWPGHPVGCEAAARSANRLDDLDRAGKAFEACGVGQVAVAPQYAAWLDRLGEWKEAERVLRRSGRTAHAMVIACVEAPENAMPVAGEEVYVTALGWCIAAGARSYEEMPELPVTLSAFAQSGADGVGRVVGAAVALQTGRPAEVAALLGDHDGFYADLLRARADGELGQTSRAAHAFEVLHDADPLNVHVIRAWSHVDPHAAESALLGLDPLLAGLAAKRRHRAFPMVALTPADWGAVSAKGARVADVFDAMHRAGSRPIPTGHTVWHDAARLVLRPGKCSVSNPTVAVLCGPPGQGNAHPSDLVALSQLAAAWALPSETGRAVALNDWEERYKMDLPTASFIWHLRQAAVAGPESVDARLPRR